MPCPAVCAAGKWIKEFRLGIDNQWTDDEEVPAICTESGVKGHWVCGVCGQLFSDAEGRNETTLEALTIPTTDSARQQSSPGTLSRPGA